MTEQSKRRANAGMKRRARLRRLGLVGLVLLGAPACEPVDEPSEPVEAFAHDTGDCPKRAGTICTIAGTGIAGDGEDGLPPRQTRLYAPADVAVSPDGALVIVDWNNHRIRKSRGGRLEIVAGVGELGEGLLVDDVTDRLNHPTDVTFDPAGRMVIAAWHNSMIKRVDMATRQIEDLSGTGARSFGGDGGPAREAIWNLPASVAYDKAGNLFVSDQANQRIRRIDTAGVVTTIAGTGMRGFGGDGGPALAATFHLPVGQQGHPAAHLAIDAAGDMFLADTLNNRVRKIALSQGAAGVVTTVAGRGTFGTAGDGGSAVDAELAQPVDVAIGPEGALYIADTENNCVRKVADGVITTVAGACGECSGRIDDPCRCAATDAVCLGDGGPATRARLKRPTGITFDRQGNLLIADTLDHRVRVVLR
jgi:DNA-binding beta-propeller fold protein YncE